MMNEKFLNHFSLHCIAMADVFEMGKAMDLHIVRSGVIDSSFNIHRSIFLDVKRNAEFEIEKCFFSIIVSYFCM